MNCGIPLHGPIPWCTAHYQCIPNYHCGKKESQLQKATYCATSAIQHSGESRTMEAELNERVERKEISGCIDCGVTREWESGEDV